MDDEGPDAPDSFAELRARLLTSSTFTVAMLAELRGEPADQTRAWLDQACIAHDLFTVDEGDDVAVPGMLLTPDGEPRTELVPLLHVLLPAGSGPWTAWVWLTSSTSLLAGGVPEQVATDAPERALVAASRFAARTSRSSRP